MYKSLFLSLLIFTLANTLNGAETILTDSEGQKAWLYTPSDAPDPSKTYWLAIGVHGAGGDGAGANGLAGWAKDDVIVLGPSFLQGSKKSDDVKSEPAKSEPAKSDGPKTGGLPSASYQMSGPTHEAKLKALIESIGKTWKIHPKVFLHGFSAGAQFVHRFAMKNPNLVSGVSAASGGSWSTRGNGEINPEARGIPFAVSCGEYDRDKSGPGSPLSRLDWMKEFAEELKKQHFDVESRVILNTGHKVTDETMSLAKECFERARAIHFSKTTFVSMDFNEANPLWSLSSEATQQPSGPATTTRAIWDSAAGVVETKNTADRTGALRLHVNSAANSKSWSGTVQSGLFPVSCMQMDLKNLTLAMDISSSSAKPIRVTLESFNAEKQRTGGLQGVIIPASPNSYLRHTLDLYQMSPSGDGEFQSTDPFLQVRLSIDNELGWATGVFHQVCLDNLNYSMAAFFVSPSGSDENDGRSEGKPFATIQKAVDRATAGDMIFLMNGKFDMKWGVNLKGTGLPAAWIVLRNYPGHKPELRSTDWNTVKLGVGSKENPSDAAAPAYVEIRGLMVRGNADEVEANHKDQVGKAVSITNGNGIGVDGRFMTNKPHHIRIADNEVTQCCGGGISVIHGDCVQVENNYVHQNCHWMIYAGSGISIYQPFNFDLSKNGFRVVVRSNHTHHNYCTQPWVAVGKLSDGNGIIIDDTRNTQNDSVNGVYRGGILVQNNLSHDNGGSGMHSYSSDGIDFINNTVAHNCTVMDYGQLSVTECSDVRVLNNVMLAPKDKPLNRVNGKYANVFLSHNLLWGGNGESVAGDFAIQSDPLFQDIATGNFSLSKQSPGRNTAGAWESSPNKMLDRGATEAVTLSHTSTEK